jgi:hypothetical protein
VSSARNASLSSNRRPVTTSARSSNS